MQKNNNKKLLHEVFAGLMKKKLSAAASLVVLLFCISTVGIEIYDRYCTWNKIEPFYRKSDMNKAYEPPSVQHPLGTDFKGRDVVLMAVFGIRTAVFIGITASILSSFLGITLGALAGYFGAWIDDIIVWIYSTFASIPTLLFILAFALLMTKGFMSPTIAEFFDFLRQNEIIDPGMAAVYIGIGLTGWVGLCRVIRSEVMKIREEQYVMAAKAGGLRTIKIIISHILPNVFHLVIIYFTIRFAYAVMTEVIVSYLGFGVQLRPSWGTMISSGQEQLWQGIWWEVAAASIFMFILVLALNLLGDRLRDILDPKLNF